MIGATAAAVAIAAIPAGAAVTGAALAGLGLGIVGLGAVAVRGSAKVKSAFTDLSESAVRTFDRAGKGMEQPIVGALNILRGTVESVGPDLREMFDDTAPHVENLAHGVDGLVRRTMPGLKRAVSESGGVLDTFAAKLPETGDALSGLFDSMADGSEGGGKALAATLGAINAQIGNLGFLLEYTSKGFDLFTGDTLFGSSILGQFADQLAKTDESQKKVTPAMALLGQGFSTLAASTNMSKAAAEAHERANLNLAESMRSVQNAALGSAGSEIAAVDARIRMNKELRDGNKTLNINTEAGRLNTSSILEGVAAAQRFGEAETKRTGSTAAGTAAQQRHTDAMFNDAVANTKNEAAVRALWTQLGLIPPLTPAVVDVKTKGDADAKRKIDDAAKARIAAIKVTDGGSADTVDRKLTLAAKARKSNIGAVAEGSVNAVDHKLTKTARPRTAMMLAKDVAAAHVESVFNRTARPRTARIMAYASADAADRALNYAARHRTAVISVREERFNITRADGGMVRSFADGGFNGRVLGAGTSTSDSIPAFLSNGEFVIKASSVDKIGAPAMDFMNRTGKIPAGGGGNTYTVIVNGPVLSKMQAQNDLLAAIDELRRQGRLP